MEPSILLETSSGALAWRPSDERRNRAVRGRAARQSVPAGQRRRGWRHELRGALRRRRRDGALPQAYGYRATGPHAPARGVRCNPAKLLPDPYARAFSGSVMFGPDVLGYAADNPDAPSAADSAVLGYAADNPDAPSAADSAARV